MSDKMIINNNTNENLNIFKYNKNYNKNFYKNSYPQFNKFSGKYKWGFERDYLKQYSFNYKKNYFGFYCTKCDSLGHDYKKCADAVLSFGIILLKFEDERTLKFLEDLNEKAYIEIRNTGVNITDQEDINKFVTIHEKVKFLMIRRKHTLGYIEFVRGRYRIDNPDGIIYLLKQMTVEELDNILKMTIEDLWDELWSDPYKKIKYSKEFARAKQKLSRLKNDNMINFIETLKKKDKIEYKKIEKVEVEQLDESMEIITETSDFSKSVELFVENSSLYKFIPNSYNQPEWGFPKGRKNKSETSINCAIREFREESGLSVDDFILLKNIEPLVEEFFGTDGVKYRHIYYVAYSNTNKVAVLDQANFSQSCEIGDIGYYTFSDVMKMIRTRYDDRRKLITRLYLFLMEKIIIKENSEKLKNSEKVCIPLIN